MKTIPQWFHQGLCRGYPTKLWYQYDSQKDKIAKKICNTCPVRADCLQFALENHETGVWGGLNDHDRKQLVRKAFVQEALQVSSQRKRPHEQEHPANASPVYLECISFRKRVPYRFHRRLLFYRLLLFQCFTQGKE